MTYKTHIVAN